MRLHAWVAPFCLLACACSAALAESAAIKPEEPPPGPPPLALPPPPPPPPPPTLSLEVDLLDFEETKVPVLEAGGSGPRVVRGIRKPISPKGEESTKPEDKPKPVAASSVQSAGGSLDQSRVQSAVAASMDSFRPCLSADAVVTLEALVSPLGEVLESHGVSSMPNDLRMRDCVSRAFRKVSLGETGSQDPTLFRLSLSLRLRR
jgi:hypothetical protein